MFKKYLPYFFSAAFIINFITSNISNFSTNSLYIKIISGLITFTIIFTNYPIEAHKLITVIKKNNILPLSFILFIAYLAISLSWSTNRSFGYLKLIHFLSANLPLFFSFCLVLMNDEIQKGLVKMMIIAGITGSIISFLFNPFNPSIPYSFEISRWSHVVFGRFTGIVFLILIQILANERGMIQILKLSFISILIFISLIISGFRSGITGTVLSIFFYYFILSFKEYDFRKNIRIVFIAMGIITISIAISFLSSNNKIVLRFEGVTELISEGRTNDGTIGSRLEAYSTGIKMFTEKFLTGQGLGGFNNKFIGNQIGTILKYPHNIIIEFLSELGLIGFGMLIFYIGMVLKKLITEESRLLVLFVYGLILAMFGKDFGSNCLVWIFAGVLCVNRNKLKSGTKN